MNDQDKLSAIFDEVCTFYGLDPREVRPRCRKRNLVTCRQVYCHFGKMLTRASLTVIGSQVNYKHDEVIHSIKQVENLKIYNGFGCELERCFSKIMSRLMKEEDKLGETTYSSMGSLTWSEL